MTKNKIIIYLTLIAILLIIALPTTYKVIKRHQDRLLNVTLKQIEETAKDCYYNGSCIENNITLKELYEKTDLPTMSNPITKMVYNELSYISVNDNFNFFEVK